MPEILPNPNLPGNSNLEKDADFRSATKEQTGDLSSGSRKLNKVVHGKVIRKKQSFFDKLSDTFFGNDSKSVGSYILWDVLIPAAKDTVSEMIRTGVDMLLFGEARSDRLRRDRGQTRINYNTIPSRRSGFIRERDHERERPDPFRSRAQHRFDDIIFESRGEAEIVLDGLLEQVESYDVATIADFYDLCGMPNDFTDNKWGWDNLARAVVSRVQHGYILVLPRPIQID